MNETNKVEYEQHIIQVSFWKAFSIVAGSVLVSIVGTAFTVGTVINNDHFLLSATVERVDSLETTAVRRDIYEIQQDQIIKELGEIKTLLNK